jgi:hypothetical protein
MATTENPAGATAIRPFTVEIPDAEVEDLRARIVATRLPEKEPVKDASQGVQLATMQALVRYWGTEYDLRRVETRLNALPQFLTEIDDLDILAWLDRRDAERRRPAHRPDRIRR